MVEKFKFYPNQKDPKNTAHSKSFIQQDSLEGSQALARIGT